MNEVSQGIDIVLGRGFFSDRGKPGFIKLNRVHLPGRQRHRRIKRRGGLALGIHQRQPQVVGAGGQGNLLKNVGSGGGKEG